MIDRRTLGRTCRMENLAMSATETPIIDWIGDIPIRHGEREDSEMCLCGHESYLTCQHWPEGGIAGLTINNGDVPAGRGASNERTR